MATTIQPNIRCEKCGGNMVVRNGARGQFLGCSNFVRGCRNTMSMPIAITNEKMNEGWLDDFICTTGSSEQNAIWYKFVNEEVNMCVQAGPGTGKSFTAANMIKYIKNVEPNASILYLVFGRANMRDFLPKSRVTIKGIDHVLAQVSTLNSFGNSILMQYYRARNENVRLDTSKTQKIVETIIRDDEWDENQISSVRSDIRRLIDHCKNYLFAGNIDELHFLASRFAIDLIDETRYVNYVQNGLRLSKNFRYGGNIIYDYGDQLWLPVVLNMSFPKIDYVMCDEVQDFNTVQHTMMKRLAENGSRIMFIGDENQSIYGFRGADTNSMNNMLSMLEDVRHTCIMPLSYTRRLPKIGVRYLNQMFPDIELHSMDDAIEGEIYSVNRSDTSHINANDLVLSRVNAPMIGLAFKLIKSGKVAYILGRDIAKKIIESIESFKANSIPDLIKKAQIWGEEQKDKIRKIYEMKQEEIPQYALENIDDTMLCIIELAKGTKEKIKRTLKRRANISDVILEITNMFKETDDDGVPANAVILSTVHKAKGLEADNVHIYTPDLFPHPMAKQDWEKQQEKNCKWVAYSRQKKTLFIYDGMEETPTKVEV